MSVILKLVFLSLLDVAWININKCFVFDWAILLFHSNLMKTSNTKALNFGCGNVAISNYCKKLTYKHLHIAAVNYYRTRRFLVTRAEYFQLCRTANRFLVKKFFMATSQYLLLFCFVHKFNVFCWQIWMT